MILGLRPDHGILGIRWVNLEYDPTFWTFLTQLAKGRYEPMRGYLVRLTALILILAALTIIHTSDLIQGAVAIVGILLIMFRRILTLPSLLIFYDDKIAILTGVTVDRATGVGAYAKRTDITQGAVRPYFKLAKLNPLWRLHNFPICIREKRFVMNRVSSIEVLSWWHTRNVLSERGITFFSAAKQIAAYVG